METLVTRPSSLVTGDHQVVAPLPVNGATYVEPIVKGVAGYGYLVGDANAAALISDQIALPDVGVNLAPVLTVGVTRLAYTGTPGTSWNVPVPASVAGDTSSTRVKAGDLAVVDCISQESVDVAAPATPGTWQTRGSWGSATGFVPRVTRFFKMMSGGETGTLVTVATASARFHFEARIIRGVDIAAYFAAAAAVAVTGQGGYADPGSLTTTADGALVEIFLAANEFPNGVDDWTPSMLPAGYAQDHSYIEEERGAVVASKIRATAGAENPAQINRLNLDNWTVVVDAYKPGTNAGLTLFVASLASDPTATAVPGTTPSLAHNEKQTITSVLPSGTFTLTWNGQTTAAINWNDSATTIQTRLRDLSNIGATDVTVTGGPLPTNPVVVEFTSALANQDVALITTSSGSVTVVETQKGHPVVTFAWEGSVNCPRWLDGVPWETGSAPQINFWSATPTSYVVGTKLSVTASDHGANNTVSAVVAVIDKALVSNPISDTLGNSVGFLARTAGTFGTITPTIPGSKIVTVLGLSTAALYSGANPNPSTPARYSRVAQVVSDRSVLDISISPPAAAAVDQPNAVSWTGSQDFVTGLLAIQPAGTAGTMTLPQVLADESLNTWADIATALGAMYEVVELGVSGVPANAIITAGSVTVQHSANARSLLRVVLVGIEADGTLHPCSELRSGGYPTDPGGATTTITTGAWVETSDGTQLSDFPRFGVALISTTRNPAVANHRVFAVSASFDYEPGGPVISNVTGPAVTGDAISWDYTSDAGLSQTHVQVRVRYGTGQTEDVATAGAPVDSLTPVWGDLVFDSGRLPGSLRRSLIIEDAPLGVGPCTVNVRAWARLSSGREVVSPWATDDFDISGSPVFPTWEIVDGRIFRPGGAELVTAGFNGGVSMGIGGWGDAEADKTKAVAWAWDRYPGAPTYQIISDIWGPDADMEYDFPGGTVTKGRYWSQTALDWVDLPDRVHAMNGVRSAEAIAFGIPEPADHWHTGFYRMAAIPRPAGVPGDDTVSSTWDSADYMTPARTIPQYVQHVKDLIGRGIVVEIQDHTLTGTNVAAPAAFVSNPVTISPDDVAFGAAAVEPYTRNTPATRPNPTQRLRDALKLYDALATDAALNNSNANILIGLPNEWYTTGRTAATDALTKALIQRLRGKGYGGLIGIPLGRWCGDLAGLANGDYDSLMTDLEAAGVGWRVFFEWHNYGENWEGGTNAPYTYDEVEAHLTACREGVAGSGRKYAVLMTECGRSVPAGTGLPNGPLATELMFTDQHGPALALRFPWICPTWWSTGDHTFVDAYALTKGASNKADENASAPSSTGPTPGTRPWWRITSQAKAEEWCTKGGLAFWRTAHALAEIGSPHLNRVTGAVEMTLNVPAAHTRAWLTYSTDNGVTWTKARAWAVTPGVSTLVDCGAPLALPEVRARVAYDKGPMSEASYSAVVGSDFSTLIDSWYLMAPADPTLNQAIDVVEFDQTRPRTVYVADNPERTVVVTSGQLGSRFGLRLRTLNPDARGGLLALLDSGEELRLVSILGESWWVRVASGVQEQMLRGARPLPTETTRHRAAHTYQVTLAETRRA